MNRPFLLKPAYKDYMWGGSRLIDDYGKETDLKPLAESWECSTHLQGESVVASGEDKGKTLGEVLKLHPEYMGTNVQSDSSPILVKLIDAKQDLSVQVHPDDEYAKIHENGNLGKTEMWYVLHADKGAKLVYGFSCEISKDKLRKVLEIGTIERYLRYISVKKGDVFFIPPGTVHAIGKGIVIAEIQESSDLTYRLFDYNRKDRYGRKRDLHIDKALDIVNTNIGKELRQPMRVLKYRNGYGIEFLGRCKYFQVERLILNTEWYRNMADYKTGSDSFKILLCIAGCGTLFGEEVMVNFFKGDCIFIPADSVCLKLHGRAQMLDIGC